MLFDFSDDEKVDAFLARAGKLPPPSGCSSAWHLPVERECDLAQCRYTVETFVAGDAFGRLVGAVAIVTIEEPAHALGQDLFSVGVTISEEVGQFARRLASVGEGCPLDSHEVVLEHARFVRFVLGLRGDGHVQDVTVGDRAGLTLVGQVDVVDGDLVVVIAPCVGAR